MLILTKILPLLVLPPGGCFLVAFLGWLLGRKSLVRIGVALLWFLSLPVVGDRLMQKIEEPLHRVSMTQLQRADAIVVLSGILRQIEGAPLGEWGEGADRFEGGLDLFNAGKAPVLVFTAGQLPWQRDCVPEGVLLSRRARLRGVPKESLLLTAEVANTAQEAVATGRLLGLTQGHSKRIILVTSAFHMERASMLFRSAGFAVQPYPVDFHATDRKNRITIIDFLPDARALRVSSDALREMIGRLVYRMGGLNRLAGK
ncbi:MAG: YdcF family protein [Chlorobiaceae bacterium]|nr:YdcF family protein [Chlorobiaceae bacterium]